ncbi:hypothetical protein [Mycobacterium europaeum]|nr:hypothetical protein [Mycobacterium europaeum]
MADSMGGFRVHTVGAERRRDGLGMGVVAFVALTVAVFAVLGLVQKLVERL